MFSLCIFRLVYVSLIGKTTAGEGAEGVGGAALPAASVAAAGEFSVGVGTNSSLVSSARALSETEAATDHLSDDETWLVEMSL